MLNSLPEEIPSFSQEWVVLHNDHEKYERYSLLIKLVSVIICFVAISFDLSSVIAILFIGIIWLQDGIWKTFQSRMSDRILLVERYIKEQAVSDNGEVAFQFYSDWDKSPKGTASLLKEYFRNSIRPTVAYPHAVLVLLQVVFLIL